MFRHPVAVDVVSAPVLVTPCATDQSGTPMRKNPERDIQCALVQHLALRRMPNALFWHTPNGGKRSIQEAVRFKKMGVLAGVSDIIAVHNAEIFACELKAPGGRATEAQREFLSRMNDAGGYGGLAEGLDEAVAMFEAWGVIRRAA